MTEQPAGGSGANLHGIAIRRGGPEDLPRVARLLELVSGTPRPLDTLHWLYEHNPAGRCRLWIAEDRASRELVGLRPVFPWRLRVARCNTLAARAGEAITHPRYRGRGIFGALVATSWAELTGAGIPFAFSFPKPGSLAASQTMTTTGAARGTSRHVLQLQRMAYPLSLRVVGGRTHPADGGAADTDGFCQSLLRKRSPAASHWTPVAIARFGEDADRLWVRAADAHGVLSIRDSRYLNWRFIEQPSTRCEVLGLRTRGELLGYVVIHLGANGAGAIVDLFGLPDPDVFVSLLAAGLRRILERGGRTASVWSADKGRIPALLRQFGFLPRDDRLPMLVHVLHDGPSAAAALDAARWLAGPGDSDLDPLEGQDALGAHALAG